MRSLSVALLACLALSCGGDPDPGTQQESAAGAAAPAGNSVPVLREAELVPRDPSSGETVSLSVKTYDEDGDEVRLGVEWYRNGELVLEGSQTTFQTFGFLRGDRIHAVVHASDGYDQVTTRTPEITLVNQPARVAKLHVMPLEPHAGNDLTAVAEGGDVDGDAFELKYQWFVNGRALKGETEPVLEKGKFRRRDQVWVEVRANDPYDPGDLFKSAVLEIPNGAPEIESDPSQATVGAGIYKYVIKATDPDRDRPLRYTLVEGPDSMQVDLLSGVLTWRVPDGAGGRHQVVVSVADPLGGISQQQFAVDVRWESEPASGR